MPVMKRATQKLRDAGHATLVVKKGLWGYSVQDTRFRIQHCTTVRKTAQEAVDDVLGGARPKELTEEEYANF